MGHYILKRFLLLFPTLLGILFINFLIVQAAPGGPVEQTLHKLKHESDSVGARIGQAQTDIATPSDYRGGQGLDQEIVEEIRKMYGFDKPWYVRFADMIMGYAVFDFGNSFFQDRAVADLIKEKLPVSISLGVWSTLIVYLISIPLGIMKAVRHGSRFDVYTSFVVVIGYAVPGFLFAVLLIILFAGGQYFDWFPLRGLTSDDFDQLSMLGKLKDYLWHIALPVLSLSIAGFAALTMLCKNSFLEEINKQYVLAAYARGATQQQVLYKHVFRNAMLIVIAGFPAAFLGMLFTGSVLIEVIFSLDGLGLLGFEATVNRDYPVVFATLFVLTLVGLIANILTDLAYVAVDPRIDFGKAG